MLATIFYDPDGNPGHPSALREYRGVFKGRIKTLNTMDYLAEPQKKIKAALLSGIRLTTAQGNRMAQTVDFRKIISRLKKEGMAIKWFWNASKDQDGKIVARYKTYYCESPLPAKGTKIDGFGEPSFNEMFWNQ